MMNGKWLFPLATQYASHTAVFAFGWLLDNSRHANLVTTRFLRNFVFNTLRKIHKKFDIWCYCIIFFLFSFTPWCYLSPKNESCATVMLNVSFFMKLITSESVPHVSGLWLPVPCMMLCVQWVRHSSQCALTIIRSDPSEEWKTFLNRITCEMCDDCTNFIIITIFSFFDLLRCHWLWVSHTLPLLLLEIFSSKIIIMEFHVR